MKWITCLLTFWLAAGLSTLALAGNIEVISARYGTKNKNVDVTEIVCKECLVSQKTISVGNSLFGDPAPGEAKLLTVQLRCNGKEMTVEAGEESPFCLSEEQLLQIDRQTEIQRAIDRAYAAGERKISIPPGVYHLNSLKGTYHLNFEGMKDFEIDATGATFIFDNHNKGGIRFTNCRNVTLKGVAITREKPPFSQGEIKALGPDRAFLDVEIDRGYPDFHDPQYRTSPMLTLFDREGVIRGELWRRPEQHKQLQGSLWRFYIQPTSATINVGDRVAWRRHIPQLNEVNITGCSGIALKDVAISNAIDVAVKEIDSEGSNYYNYRLTYASPPQGAERRPLLSSGADGFHSCDARKGPVLDHCVWDGCHDDAVNIHGTALKLLSANGKSMTVKLRRPMNNLRAGDLFRFYNAKRIPVGEAVVESWRKDASGAMELTCDRPIPADALYAFNQNTSGADFQIRNCVTRNHRARGFVLRSGGIVENCLIERTLEGAILIRPEISFWQEGPFAENLMIRGNTFRQCSPCATNATLCVDGYDRQEGFALRPGGHRNITIENNRFENNSGPNLLISSAVGVEVKRNLFLHPMQENGQVFSIATDRALVLLTECSDIRFSGNEVVAPGKFMKRIVSCSPSAEHISGLDGGFSILTETEGGN